jgi:hypothetical protein
MKSLLQDPFRVGYRLLGTAMLLSAGAYAQSTPDPVPAKVDQPDLNAKIDLLTKSLQQTQVELAQSRTEIQELRAALEEALKRMNKVGPPSAPAPQENAAISSSNAPQASNQEARPAQISQDDWEILNARLEEQRQTKVESASKYRLKLSGIALFNAFGTSGQVDNLDLPSIALPRFGGFPEGGTGASIRQSIVGLSGIGPVLFGAQTSGDVQMDFYGGLPYGYGSTGSGIARVRLARMRFDWKNTSAIAGLDYPFFSPNLPTTYMSLAVPGFASAGNQWTWTPTVRLEHRFTGTFAPLKVEAGLLDPASSINYSPNTNLRFPNSTEYSRQPTYGMRLSVNRKSEDHAASLGVSGVYSPQTFFGGYHLSGWLGAVDWKLPALPRTELSGQFFTGRGTDGFGGVPLNPFPPQNLVLYTTLTTRLLAEVGSIGGWSQLKFRVNSRNEFNLAAGTGGRNSARLRDIVASDPSVSFIPARNQMLFANYIFKPRSDLLFSAEYRRLRTYEVTGSPDTAGQFGLAVGFLF